MSYWTIDWKRIPEDIAIAINDLFERKKVQFSDLDRYKLAGLAFYTNYPSLPHETLRIHPDLLQATCTSYRPLSPSKNNTHLTQRLFLSQLSLEISRKEITEPRSFIDWLRREVPEKHKGYQFSSSACPQGKELRVNDEDFVIPVYQDEKDPEFQTVREFFKLIPEQERRT